MRNQDHNRVPVHLNFRSVQSWEHPQLQLNPVLVNHYHHLICHYTSPRRPCQTIFDEQWFYFFNVIRLLCVACLMAKLRCPWMPSVNYPKGRVRIWTDVYKLIYTPRSSVIQKLSENYFQWSEAALTNKWSTFLRPSHKEVITNSWSYKSYGQSLKDMKHFASTALF